MTDLFAAFLSDIANDCVNGHPEPMDWSATDEALDELAADDEPAEVER